MRDILVSVIIPVYKVEKYLRRCLDSVKNQTYQNIEVILVDDGSPDHCPEICDEYVKDDGRFRVIHKLNGGVSSARNCGLKSCGGGYLVFVDPDDVLREDIIEECVNVINNTEIDAIVFGLKLKNTYKDKVLSETEYIPGEKYNCNNIEEILYGPLRYMFGIPSEDINNTLFENGYKYNQFLWCWCWFYRAEAIRNNNIFFREDLKLREDGIFNCEVLMHINKIKAIQRIGYEYYKREDGASAFLAHDGVDVANKIMLVKYRSYIKDYINENLHIDISKWTYGSYVLSVIQLCAKLSNEKNGYSKLKRYIELEEVQKAIAEVPLKGRVQLTLPLFLLKIKSYKILFYLMFLAKKMKIL